VSVPGVPPTCRTGGPGWARKATGLGMLLALSVGCLGHDGDAVQWGAMALGNVLGGLAALRRSSAFPARPS
jgi:hypothetical protein